ncbi:hypothetical protein Ctha_1897 [Chloroherpeton thalassium ATCC 35110]|uniref:Uncharacterized protein n=1 Tax=Chloroherpeton thalassium (strain ATCC 35110 / GB-78) TaxID=517418 RepID=B3QUA4_CHLT3|nr:hypothetical protein Ctha_1897 [Chloroherpeton thalassium ATCC 35110]
MTGLLFSGGNGLKIVALSGDEVRLLERQAVFVYAQTRPTRVYDSTGFLLFVLI